MGKSVSISGRKKVHETGPVIYLDYNITCTRQSETGLSVKVVLTGTLRILIIFLIL